MIGYVEPLGRPFASLRYYVSCADQLDERAALQMRQILCRHATAADYANLGLLARRLCSRRLASGQTAQRSHCANSGAALNEYTSNRGLSFVICHFGNLSYSSELLDKKLWEPRFIGRIEPDERPAIYEKHFAPVQETVKYCIHDH